MVSFFKRYHVNIDYMVLHLYGPRRMHCVHGLLMVGFPEWQKPEPQFASYCTRERRILEFKVVVRYCLNYFLVVVDAYMSVFS